MFLSCSFLPGLATLSVLRLTFSQSGSDFTASVDCTLTGSTAGVCLESFGGSAANFPGLSTTTLEKSDITFFPVTVTAGLAGSGGSGTGAVPTTGTVSETGAAASSMQLSDTAQATSSSASASAGAATSSGASSGGAASGKGETLVGLSLLGLALACF